MPRHPRIHAAGVLYHIMARGNNGRRKIALNGHSGARGTPTERLNGEIGVDAGPFCQAVIEPGYRAAEVAAFLHCHLSKMSRALQKGSS